MVRPLVQTSVLKKVKKKEIMLKTNHIIKALPHCSATYSITMLLRTLAAIVLDLVETM
jgi:hypothetical protein